MRKTLIVYHSRTGNTRRVAQALACRLDADVEEIRIVQPMGGALGYAFCALEAMAALAPALRPARKDPAAYDLVVIGTPVWYWSLSSPVRSWLVRRRLTLGRVAFFCTMGSSGAQRVFRTMAALAGRVPVSTLALTDRQIEQGIDDKLDTFVQQVKTGAPRPSGRATRRALAAHAIG